MSAIERLEGGNESRRSEAAPSDRKAGPMFFRDPQVYPSQLQASEAKLVERRRTALGSPAIGSDRQVHADSDWVGCGLSGGGIRSATVCLGFFQALARLRLVRRIDFLSTVSGGGYFGSFFGRLFSRESVQGPDDVEAILHPRSPDETPRSPPDAPRDPRAWHRQAVPNLRENGRYLSPNGAGDLLLAGAIVVRNWVAIQTVLISLILLLCLLAQWPGVLAATFGWSFLGVEAGSVLSLSPWTWIAAGLFVVAAIPTGWSYWLVGRHRLWIHPVAGAGLVLLLGIHGVVAWPELEGGALVGRRAGLVLVGLVGITLLLCAVSGPRTQSSGDVPREEAQRGALSRWLKRALIASAAIGVLALVDTAALRLLARFEAGELGAVGASIWGMLLAAGGLAQRLVRSAPQKGEDGKRLKLPASLLAGFVAILIGAVVLVTVDVSAATIAWREVTLSAPLPPGRLVWATLLVAAFALVFAHAAAFLNRSSHHALYASRLTRAYLGASGYGRASGLSLTQTLPGDDVDLGSYSAPATFDKGAPLHLINVTVNETVGGRNKIQQQDRQGVGLAVGPCGLHLGARHHLALEAGRAAIANGSLETSGWRVFRGDCAQLEPLTVGKWVAISGAAFTTGLGYRTSLGLSFLCGFANVRLGYWWRSGSEPASDALPLDRLVSAVLPVHHYLLSEFFARFPGTALDRWYLSDGGHFENLGGYELIRRRLPRILIVDAECDPEYTCGGLANLVRKARLDFGTEISFWDEDRLRAEGAPIAPAGRLGTLADLRPSGDPRFSKAHAALADVIYSPREPPGLLLYVKATVHGDEPADVLQYRADHWDFPHQTTADQFFDEAQWESYRKLGESMGSRLFGAREPGPQAPEQQWLTDRTFGETA